MGRKTPEFKPMEQSTTHNLSPPTAPGLCFNFVAALGHRMQSLTRKIREAR